MTGSGINAHTTVIAVGLTGLAFVGPSGSGKSSLAFSCIAEARRNGRYGALVADDQAWLQILNGSVIASRPVATAGLLELRHSGIVEMGGQRSTVIHYCVLPVGNEAERLPLDDECYEFAANISVPLLRIVIGCSSPLAWIESLIGTRHRSDD
ncbi:hypothetical protein J5J10_18200 [Ciceribacter sp. L1K23]|uniref:HPr kinase/phosphorylase n=1 Tax=unclassified Ciceribacter TaxID=2628820 RepID=UPI001ABE3A4F|nr:MULTISPECIES: hypothetical protein [unclassified Ciceribacter]MBO3758301.1 hypothetical protein [Ciceribacter sp. L1K22]MBR0557622.1 hypothetical protein [Ciceribacter sp. L1K23]